MRINPIKTKDITYQNLKEHTSIYLCLLFLILSVSPLHAEHQIRIAVGRFRSQIILKAPDLKVRSDGQVMQKGFKQLSISIGKNGISWKGDQKKLNKSDSDILYIESSKDITLHGHKYTNYLEISLRIFKGKRELLVVHPIGLEHYVTGIVASELPKKWPLEALKAQAVAARTYALWQKYRRLNLPYHMESSVLDQVYHGAEREHPMAIKAVKETYGIVLAYDRHLVEAYFHSTCGGHTESAKYGWGKSIDYLPGGKCNYCQKSNKYNWKHEFSQKTINQKLRKTLGENVLKIQAASKTPSGRVKKFTLLGSKKRKSISGNKLRQKLGYAKLWSTQIRSITKTKKGFLFKGKGAGHGVGMCQWGANGMAFKKKSYKEILQLYYPKSQLPKIY